MEQKSITSFFRIPHSHDEQKIQPPLQIHVEEPNENIEKNEEPEKFEDNKNEDQSTKFRSTSTTRGKSTPHQLTRFQDKWLLKGGLDYKNWIERVQSDIYRYHCAACNKTGSCENLKNMKKPLCIKTKL